MSNWTTTENIELDAFWDAGVSTVEIGRRMGRSKNAIIGRAHRRGLPPRPSPIKRGGEVRAPLAAAAGKTTLPALASIEAPILRTTPELFTTVAVVPMPRKGMGRKTTDADEIRIRALRANGLGYKRIALRTGFSIDVIRRVAPAQARAVIPMTRVVSKPLPVSLVPRPMLTPPPPRTKECCWPVGDPGTRGFRFCGDPNVMPGKPYCEEHCGLAYVKVRKAEAEAEAA